MTETERSIALTQANIVRIDKWIDNRGAAVIRELEIINARLDWIEQRINHLWREAGGRND